MADSRIIRIEGAGDVLFERSRKARRISISVRPFKGARVAVPYRVSFKQAEAFARSQAEWIRKHLSEARRLEANGPPTLTDTEKKQARALLTAETDRLAAEYGYSYNRLSFRSQKTRWGSCSVKNNISLNYQLVRLPEELRDYVLLHELVHTKIKDHSPKFWKEMDRLLVDAKKLSRRLKKYRLGVV